jgi:acyl dehydratase
VSVDLASVGTVLGPVSVSWSETDTLLYALGVGAGQEDPLAELEFTTENSQGVSPRVLPTFGVIVVQRAALRPSLGVVNRTMVLHAEQSVTIESPLPASGQAVVTATLKGIYDKGSGALAVTEAVARDVASDRVLVRTVSSAFLRGSGGFGGDRGPDSAWSEPEGPPDERILVSTRRDQALLYRLSGDRNPLHSDPAVSRRAGFERPILHGLCTFGVVGRVLLRIAAGDDPARFRQMEARFSKPVFPGDTLTVEVWATDPPLRFRVRNPAGDVVLDRGRLVVAAG